MLKILERDGIVFHARTTQPQSLMRLETDSKIYVATVHLYNRDLSAGGASGSDRTLVGPH